MTQRNRSLLTNHWSAMVLVTLLASPQPAWNHDRCDAKNCTRYSQREFLCPFNWTPHLKHWKSFWAFQKPLYIISLWSLKWNSHSFEGIMQETALESLAIMCFLPVSEQMSVLIHNIFESWPEEENCRVWSVFQPDYHFSRFAKLKGTKAISFMTVALWCCAVRSKIIWVERFRCSCFTPADFCAVPVELFVPQQPI